ncbi:hypothetical protein DV735_g1737, partial [Chaetothyriales sp. CBS 134920]
MPSSAFLLARLDTLRNSLLEHFKYIIEASQVGRKVKQVSRDPATDRIYDETIEVDETKTPSLAQTKMDQVRMNVEVEGLIKKCEDLLALSRALKEGWIFGGLDTIKKSDDDEAQREIEEWVLANENMQQWMSNHFRNKSSGTTSELPDVGDYEGWIILTPVTISRFKRQMAGYRLMQFILLSLVGVASLALSIPMKGPFNSNDITLNEPIEVLPYEVHSIMSGENVLAPRGDDVYGVYQCEQPAWRGNCTWDGPGVEDGKCRKTAYGAIASIGPDKGIRCSFYRSPNCNGPGGSNQENKQAQEQSLEIGNIFVMGGAQIYAALLALPPSRIGGRPVRILQTQCDTFFPIALEEGKDGLRRVDHSELTGEWLRTEVGERIGLPQEGVEWLRDDKAGVEIRTVGWERQ